MRDHIRCRVTKLTSFEHSFDVSFECLGCGEGKAFHISDPAGTQELQDEHYTFMMCHMFCPELKQHYSLIVNDMQHGWNDETTDPGEELGENPGEEKSFTPIMPIDRDLN